MGDVRFEIPSDGSAPIVQRPRKSKSPTFRGSLQARALVQRDARERFLQEIEETAPEVLKELGQLRTIMADRKESASSRLIEWAKGFGLVDRDGNPPEWILSCARLTIGQRIDRPSGSSELISRYENWAEALPSHVAWSGRWAKHGWGLFVPTRLGADQDGETALFISKSGTSVSVSRESVQYVPPPDDQSDFCQILLRQRYDPQTETRTEARRRIVAGLRSQLQERMVEIEETVRKARGIMPPTKVFDDHYRWLVMHRVQGKTIAEIADTTHHDEMSVRRKLETLAKTIGISRRRGRPKKRGDSAACGSETK